MPYEEQAFYIIFFYVKGLPLTFRNLIRTLITDIAHFFRVVTVIFPLPLIGVTTNVVIFEIEQRILLLIAFYKTKINGKCLEFTIFPVFVQFCLFFCLFFICCLFVCLFCGESLGRQVTLKLKI